MARPRAVLVDDAFIAMTPQQRIYSVMALMEMDKKHMPTIKDKISPHFYMNEVACRDRNRTLPTGAALASAERVAELMERIRQFFGNLPITVNSWYRTETYNKQVGGAKSSQHVLGRAVDFTVEGVKPAEVQKRLAAVVKELGIGGLGFYPTFTHIDLGRRRTWRG